MPITNRTLACLIRLYQTITQTHNDVDLDILEFGLADYIMAISVNPKSYEFLKALHDRANAEGDFRDLLEVTERTLGRANHHSGGGTHRDRLINALRLDGYELSSGTLTPTTPAPASLGPQISQLENDLTQANLDVAATHYGQACDNFTRGRWEASNGSLRSFLENLYIELGTRKTGTKHSTPHSSLQGLEQQQHIDAHEHQMLKIFFNNIYDQGPHHGRSSEHEALFRLHVGTAIGRYLLGRLDGET